MDSWKTADDESGVVTPGNSKQPGRFPRYLSVLSLLSLVHSNKLDGGSSFK
jgi:hypothetical protein